MNIIKQDNCSVIGNDCMIHYEVAVYEEFGSYKLRISDKATGYFDKGVNTDIHDLTGTESDMQGDIYRILESEGILDEVSMDIWEIEGDDNIIIDHIQDYFDIDKTHVDSLTIVGLIGYLDERGIEIKVKSK